jgi:monoamine oxidase
MPPKRPRVLVLGAGLAGLTAARYLERAGADVTIIEARARIGGRILTMRDGFAEGQHAELGADLIEEEQTPVLELAKALKLGTVRILRRGWGFHGGSRRAPITKRVSDTFERVEELLKSEIEAYKCADSRWDSAVAQRIAGESAAAWLKRVRANREVAAGVRGLRGFFLADAEHLSMLPVVDQFAEGGAPGASAMYRLKDGNDALPATIARGLKATIHLEAPATRIVTRGRTVAVSCGGRNQAKLTADFVVSTLPATTLRRVVFEPALNRSQAEAIRALSYGPATKALLQFENRFWKRLTRSSAYASDRSTGAVWDANEQQARAPGILTLLAGGSASREVREMIAQRGWKGLVRQLSWLGEPAHLIAAASYSWEADRWARGGYAVFTPRFDPALRDWLARPSGRIVFAGEHTSRQWQGFMSGAIESGRRAALEVAMLARLPYERIVESP